jgi:HD-like signal output (HDOD) protein
MSAVATMLASPICSADEIVREVQCLPSAPKVLPRLKQLLLDGNSSMREIVSLIRIDPGIAARVLRVANSVYYSKGARCLAVEDAVARVGYNQVYEMVAYAVASQVLARPLTVYGVEADELWAQSVACALAAETLASVVGEDRSVAYTTGLLHSVGMVAIDEWAVRHAPVLMFRHQGLPREYVESERALLGTTQAEVGGALLDHWDFPPSMAEPVRWQYTPLGTARYLRQAALLHAAKWIRSMVCREGAPPPLPEACVLQPLRLAPTQLVRMAGEVRLKLVAVKQLLELQ